MAFEVVGVEVFDLLPEFFGFFLFAVEEVAVGVGVEEQGFVGGGDGWCHECQGIEHDDCLE